MTVVITTLQIFQERLLNFSTKILALSTLVGFMLFFGIILFVFIPTSAIMAGSGYGIFEFQLAWTKPQMDSILLAWVNIIDVVIYQTLLDFVFIIGSIVLFSSIFLLLTKTLHNETAKSSSKFGMWFAFSAGSFDAIENVLSLVILSSSTNYSEILVFLVSFFASIKFLLIFVEFPLLIVLLLQYTIEKIK